MARSAWVFPVFLAASSLVLALAAPACTCRNKEALPDGGGASDRGTPVGVGALLTRFDVMAPQAATGYDPRVLARLGVAKPALHDAVVAMPAGLTVKVTWETRDDLVTARRYVTLWKVTVDAVAPATSCVVSRTQPVTPAPAESMRPMLSIDYVCKEGRSVSNLGLNIGQLDERGFTPIGFATGAAKPAVVLDPPELSVVRFAPKSAALDAAAVAVVEAYVKVLGADPALTLCLGYRFSKPNDAVQTKRRAAVRAAFLERAIPAPRISETVGTGQAPPADDDLELYPFDKTCEVVAAAIKRH